VIIFLLKIVIGVRRQFDNILDSFIIGAGVERCAVSVGHFVFGDLSFAPPVKGS
jgi:hypothetical protein